MDRLVAYVTLKGIISTVTSMYLNNMGIEDLPVISSDILRNKMADLLSLYYGLEREKRWSLHRCKDQSCFFCLIFGTNNMRRLIIKNSLPVKRVKYFPWEFKAEGNSFIRRVPVDTSFHMEMIYRIFDFNKDRGKRDSENFKYILEAIVLIEENYLGKGGGRGNGKVNFSDLSVNIFTVQKEDSIDLSLPQGWMWHKERGIILRNASL
jgi:CRISPR/Cas system CSM-associated protein Csm3 (group 7 of RAMP superfamily)